MLRLILSNRWLAVLWVISVALAASRFAGKGGEAEKALEKVAERSQQVPGERVEQFQTVPEEAPSQRAFGEGTDPAPYYPGG